MTPAQIANRPNPTQAAISPASVEKVAAARAGVRQRIDDAAEQDGLGELGSGERQIAQPEQPAEAGLGAEQCQHARVDSQ